MIPALFIRMSRRFDFDLKISTADETDLNEARSRGRKLIWADGTASLISVTATSPLVGVRAAR